MYKRNVLMQMEHGAHFVNTADSEAESAAFDPRSIHVVANQKDQLFIVGLAAGECR